MKRGKLLIFSAPSGAGKTTIVKHLLRQDPNLQFSISATSRDKRHTETDGKDYYFLSPENFKKKITENAFLEWEEVYSDKYYGTLKSEVEKKLSEGINVVFDVDVVGGLNIKKQYADKALAIFIQPPSIDELRKRLESRATDSKEVIQSRIDKAAYELTFKDQFDVCVVNDSLKSAIKETEEIVQTFLKA